MKFYLLVLFLLLVSGQSSPVRKDDDDIDPVQEQWVWCVEDAKDLQLCNNMAKILLKVDPEQGEHNITCVTGGDSEGCMKKISVGEAKIGIFDGGEIFQAYNQYGLKPIRVEHNNVEEHSYYGVGIVKANQCPKKLSDLRGRRSCHTGYGRSAGWVLPVTYMLDNKIMPLVSKNSDVNNDIESVRAFFSKSCAASGDPKKAICTACKNSQQCTEDDDYYDYAGAFRCLVEGSGDVAFTKHSIPGQYVKGGDFEDSTWKNVEGADSYRILCPGAPDGSLCTEINNYKKCNFGAAPGHTVMVWSNFSSHEIGEFNEVMNRANNNDEFKDLFPSNVILSNEFAAGVSDSIAFNGTVEGLMGSLLQTTLELKEFNKAPSTPGNSVSGLVPATFVTIFFVLLVAILTV